MNEFLQMNVFFFVTTLVVIALGVLTAVILWRIQRILRHVEHISEQVALESENVRHDLSEMRSDIREGKGRLMSLFGFVKKTTRRASKKS